MNKRLKFLIYIFVFVLAYAAYYWVVPLVVNLNSRVPAIEKLAKKEFGVDIKITKPTLKMGLSPSVWVDADDFKLLAADKSAPFHVVKPKLKIRILPLLIGKVNLAYFSCDYINADLKFDKSGRFYIGNSLIISNSNPILSLENSKMKINGYKIRLKDEMQSKNFELNGDYFDLIKFNSKKYLKFSTDSRLKVNNRYSSFNLDLSYKLPFKNNFDKNDLVFNGSVTNLNLADLAPYIRKFSKNNIKKTAGIINLDAKTKNINKKTNQISSYFVCNNLLLLGKDKASTINFKEKLTVHTIFDVSKNTLNIEKFKISSKRIHANLSGKITKIKSNNPRLNLTVAVDKSRIEDFIALIPAYNISKKDINLVALKNHGYYSDLDGKLSIKGKSSKPYIYGEIFSNKGYVIKPIPNNVPKATVKLLFTGDKMDMKVFVPTGINEWVKVYGLIELYGAKNTTLDISSTNKVDLHTAQSVLVPVHEVFNFDLGPLPIMKLAGLGNINLKVKGSNIDPHLVGAFNFEKATVGFNDVDMLVKNGVGTLIFDDKNTHFFTKSAYLNGEPINIDGKCSLLGVLDYDVIANNQDLGNLLDILNNSPMLADVQKMVRQIDKANGRSNFTLKLSGIVKNIDQIKFGKTILASGEIKLLGNNVWLKGFNHSINNMKGSVKFNNTDLDLDLYSAFDKSKLYLLGKIKNDVADFKFNSKLLRLSDIFKYMSPEQSSSFKYTPSFSNTAISVSGAYFGSIDKFDFNKLAFISTILPEKANNSELFLKNGRIELKNSTLRLTKVNGAFKNNAFLTSAVIKNFLHKNQSINGSFYCNDFDIASFKSLANYPFIAPSIKKFIGKFSSLDGKIDIKASVRNNNFASKIKLNNITMVYTPMNLPIKFFSGTAELKNQKIMLYKVNSLLDTMPILVDGTIDDVFTHPNFNLYVNSKPNQKFIETYINKNALYPLKIRGDLIYSSRLKGTLDSFTAKTEINLQEDSNIYYMGSTLGDPNDPIRLYIDARVNKNYIDIWKFQYDKLISSQNNKEFISSQLNAKGTVEVRKSNIFLHNFKVKTQNPTDAKIFNILFKKPMIKQGLFTSDILINGAISAPYILGDLNFTGIDIPLLDTTIKDVALDFQDNEIKINSTGEIFSNKIIFDSTMLNNLNLPYTFKDISVYCANLDINAITKRLNNLQIEADKHKISTQKQDIDLSSIVVQKAQLKADNVTVKNISANNLVANMSLNEKLIFALDNFRFDIAEGVAKGNFKYNLLNSHADLDLNIKNVNANLMSEALFDLPSQIYGNLTGEVALYCNGKTHKTCMNTLSGRGGFKVIDGKMPKLGSLEYLLKAANLIKSGVTGLSINGIIDMITPLKTGQFESIVGSFNIDSGVANSIQIFSKGKDLSIFIDGTYNFATIIADMNIYGRISKKISTILGPIGNASLNTLFNTIPGLNLDEANNAKFIESINKIPGFELNDKLYRIFTVKIYGDINGDNYVQSFKWVE